MGIGACEGLFFALVDSCQWMVVFGLCEVLNGLNRLLFGRLGQFLGRFSFVFIVGGMRSMSDVVGGL